MNIKRLSTKQPDFDAQLNLLLAFEETADEKLEATVAAILADVKRRGDEALLEYTRRFDRLNAAHASEFELPRTALRQAFEGLPPAQRSASPTSTKSNCKVHGATPKQMAPCSVSRLLPWIGLVCTFPVVKQLIRRRY